MSTLALFDTALVPTVLSTDAQCTPRDLALALGRFGVDPCSNPLSHILSDRTCMLERGQDGLADPWTVDGTDSTDPTSVWCNGPYSKPFPWCERLRWHRAPWCSLWKLETTTAWFREALADGPNGYGAQWAPFASRLAFVRNGNVGSAEFCSVLIWRDWTPPAEVAAMLVPQGSWEAE
jgi:hypothetical protein